jgi:ribonucleoside-diphosphate reductase alpha chain
MADKLLTSQTSKSTKTNGHYKNGNGHAKNGHALLNAMGVVAKNPTQIRVLPEPIENGTTLTGVSQKVFIDRYSLKDEMGNPLEKHPEQMWRRIARAVSQIEMTQQKKKEWEEKFYWAMEGFKFVPGGRILSGAGTGFDVTYYNCYVLPSPKDSRRGIMENITDMIDIMARGGGVGVNLSSLRPRGARVKKVNGFSSGPMTWAELYSVATHDVIQQGGTRRGALMLMLWDWHPDIEEFITVKKDLSRIIGANLSICVSDRLMDAVKKDEDWPLLFPDIDDPDYDLMWDGILDNWVKAGKAVKVYKTIKARALWDMICEAAWASAEPGLHFMERTNKLSSNSYFNYLNCTNPCGEEPLPAYGVCNLGSLNLATFVNDKGEFDYESLEAHTRIATRMLDNVVDGDIYIFDGIRKTQLEGERRIGVGTMGLGDALIKMQIRYGSEESIPVIEKIYKIIRDAAFDESANISREKGAFPKFDKDKYPQGPFIKAMPEELQKKIKKYGVRNSVILMQAPTGSTSLMSEVTSGIEPVYEFSFTRRDRLGEHKIYHPLLQAWKDAHPGEEVPSYFVSSSDLTPEDHILVQAAVQKYVDASISKTVNAPNSFTIDDVKKLYMMAYDLGLKGVTFFRDGSRAGVLSKEEPKKEEKKEEIPAAAPAMMNGTDILMPRPERVEGVTYRAATPLGSAFITINNDEAGNPLEVFINIGKAGSDIKAMAEAFGRLLSAMLRIQGNTSQKDRVLEIVDQLSGIGGRNSIGFGPNRVRSVPDAIAQVLARHFAASIKNSNNESNDSATHAELNHIAAVANGDTQSMQAGAVMAAHNPDPTPAPAALNPSAGDPAVFNPQMGFSDAPASAVPGPAVYMSTNGDMSKKSKSNADICPECGSAAFVSEEGCHKCYACGHSEC